ncbi:TadE/TadG family type IV pilus assembly protein [Kitasatospora sp. DSM 101779]|uniref:TadE/TadG family type IV pilus assembly protein n=1 Tax=Kitasatospora sp. DSM 101779 TaxID=2853165 RepID=UPI0021D8AD8E|nr:TadE family protein [Kitasatospora sp. DSM 101779]MCU7821751.1 pilus assembly protein [Kitasatospora sp. DSM 101779]
MTARAARRRPAAGRDTGAVPVEAALLLPVVLAFVLIVVAAGRVQSTGAVVDAAARAGARAASLARTEDGARQAAADAVQDVLGRRKVRCAQDPVTPVSYGTLQTPGGELGTVTVRVRCSVPLRDLLGVDALQGDKTMTGEFTSVVDRYRGD